MLSTDRSVALMVGTEGLKLGGGQQHWEQRGMQKENKLKKPRSTKKCNTDLASSRPCFLETEARTVPSWQQGLRGWRERARPVMHFGPSVSAVAPLL